MYKFDFKLKAMIVITHDMIYELPCRSIERIFVNDVNNKNVILSLSQDLFRS